jgi:hypothetical protein
MNAITRITAAKVDAEISAITRRLHRLHFYPYQNGCRCEYCRSVGSRVGMPIPVWDRRAIRKYLENCAEYDEIEANMQAITGDQRGA